MLRVGTGSAFLAAAHCVGDLGADDLKVLLPGLGPRAVTGVVRHESADIAIVRVDDGDACPGTIGPIADSAPATSVDIYGYPADIFGQDQGRPVPRVLSGHVQRVMPWTSPLGFRYEASELSQPSPPGMSGGPVLVRAGVVALAVESQSSTTVLDSVETRQGGVCCGSGAPSREATLLPARRV